MKGLIYKELPIPGLIHSESIRKRLVNPLKNKSFGNSGIFNLNEDLFILPKFSSGRNSHTFPLESLYAFIPSKTACP